ncbi:putative MFS transporter [Nitrobacteraceae bacterium AZCC 2146]
MSNVVERLKPTSLPLSAGIIAARLDRMPFSRWHLQTRLLVGTATFFDAFDALGLAQILPVLVPLWKMSGTQVGLLISMGYVGQLLGAVMFGFLAEKWGRVPVLMMAITVFSVMSALCSISWDYQSLLIFRTLQGVGLGGEVPIAAVYISELAKAKGRGRFVLLYETIFSVGVVIASLIGAIVVPTLGWEYMFYIGAVPIFLVLLVWKFVPESPRWLANHGRLQEADRVVAEIERSAERTTGRALPEPAPAQEISGLLGRMSWQDIVGPRYIRRSIVVWTVWFSCYLVYYSLATWLPTLYRTLFNVQLDLSLRYGLIANCAILAGSLCCAFTIDIVGRKTVFVVSLLGAAFCLFSLWFLGATTVTQVVVFGSIACFFAASSALGVYVYTPELYPTRSRAIATSLGTAWLRFASMLGPLIVGMFVHDGIQTVFLLFGIVSVIGAVVVATLGIETKGKTLEEIAK